MHLLDDDDAGVLDPASAAIGLTVGALCSDDDQGVRSGRDHVEVQPLGRPGRPSAITLRGPGAMGMVKPELCAPGGSVAFDDGRGRIVEDRSLHVVGAGGERPEQLLADGAGTSFAAPLVAHAALRVLGRYPTLSANSVRALVLASAQPIAQVIGGRGDAANAKEQRRLTGYGRVSAERAEASDDYRAVLLAEHAILIDDVHLYRVPSHRPFTDPAAAADSRWRSPTTLRYGRPGWTTYQAGC